MHLARRIVAGAGGLLAGALITLISMAGNQWVKDHPTEAFWIGGSLLLGAAFCFIFFVLTHEKRSAGSANSGNFARRDNRGIQIASSTLGNDAIERLAKAAFPPPPSKLHISSAEYVSTLDPNRRCVVTECLRLLITDDRLTLEVENHNFVTPDGKNHVPKDPHARAPKKLVVVYSFNGGPLLAKEVPEGRRLDLPEVVSARHPVLDVGLSGGEVEVFDDSVRFVESGGKRCDVMLVHNRQAKEGEAHVAKAISARLTFTPAGSSKTTFVDRACWVGKVENEIYLHPGDTEHVLLRMAKDEEWLTYANPNKYDSGGWPARNLDLREVKFPLSANAEIVGEISIIAHENLKATTLKTRGFTIKVDQVGMFVNIRMDDEA
jgi:hypothetical protein